MLDHKIVEEVIHISIEKVDFSFRIPVAKLGKTISWQIGEKGTEGIIMKNVSIWTLQLFTKKITDEKFVLQFKDLVQKYAPKNSIDWKETLLAVTIQNDYNQITAANKIAVKKMEEEEIIALLEEKYDRA